MATSQFIAAATIAGLLHFSAGAVLVIADISLLFSTKRASRQRQGLDSSTLATLQASSSVENGIAWVHAFTAIDNGAWTFDSPFDDLAGFVDFAQYATSIRITSANYDVYATECSNPVWCLNNGLDMSFTVDTSTGLVTGYADRTNWNGNQEYMWNSCYPYTGVGQSPRALTDSMYHACNNGPGLHLKADTLDAQMGGDTTMEVYLGFDEAWSTDCYGNDIVSRDCSILAIDNFLLYCSDEFASQNADIDGLSTQITDLETRVGIAETDIQTNADGITNLQAADSALETRVTANEGDIAALQTEISSTISSEIAQLQDDIAALNARVDLFASFAAQQAPVGLVDGAETAGNSQILSTKDFAILSLLTVNLVLMSFICCRVSLCKQRKRKYVSVAMDEESEFSEAQALRK